MAKDPLVELMATMDSCLVFLKICKHQLISPPVMIRLKGVIPAELHGKIDDIVKQVNELNLTRVNVDLILTFFYKHRDEKTYEAKKKVVSELNQKLRESGAAIERTDGHPHTLFAIPSRDGEGRYTFENKITHRRNGSYKSIDDILPISLIVDIPKRNRIKTEEKKED